MGGRGRRLRRDETARKTGDPIRNELGERPELGHDVAPDEFGSLSGHLAVIFDTIAEGILITAPDGRYLYANRAAERLLGAARRDIVGRTRASRPWKILSVDGKPDVPESRPTLRTLRTGQPVSGVEMVIERPDGTRIVLSVSTALARDDTHVVGVVNTLSDITERKRAEDALIELVARERQARAEAEGAVQARDAFLSIASHELRTPLTSLQLQVGILRRRVLQDRESPPDLERWAHALDGVDRQVRQLRKLVSDLLDVSELGAAPPTLRRQHVDLAEVVERVVDRVAAQIARAGSRVSVHAQGPVHGWWDVDKIERIVANLLDNALKYGLGRPIELHLGQEGAKARLMVSDEGVGIAEKDLAHVFDRFVCLSVTEHYTGGFGLGLYIARQLVEAHGGTISVTSEPGSGSRFLVELPTGGPGTA